MFAHGAPRQLKVARASLLPVHSLSMAKGRSRFKKGEAPSTSSTGVDADTHADEEQRVPAATTATPRVETDELLATFDMLGRFVQK